jgi:hypothetical protein
MDFPIFRHVDNFVIRVNQEREEMKKAAYIVDYMAHYIRKGTVKANRQVLQSRELLGSSNFRRMTSSNYNNLAVEINCLIETNIRYYNCYMEVTKETLQNARQGTEEVLREKIQDIERILREFDRIKDVVLNTLLSIRQFYNRPVLTTKCIKNTESKSNEECPICLNDNIPTRNMLWFKCNHGVCSTCLIQLLTFDNNKCPLCRQHIRKVCIKYSISEGTKEQIMKTEVSKKLLNSVCRNVL